MAPNVLFLSPHFPPGWHRFCKQLKVHGARVIGVGDVAPGALSDQVRASLDEYVYRPDLNDVDALEALGRHLIQRWGPIHRIDSLNEHWLGVEAELRVRLGVPGMTPDFLKVGRDKVGMTRRYREAGIPCAQGHEVGSLGDLQAFAHEVGFPLILKPAVGVGAQGATRIDTSDELLQVYAKIDTPYLAESFVVGDVVSFDGLTDGSGEIVFHTAHINCAGVLECSQGEVQTWYHSYRDIPPALEAMGRKVVAAFDLRERFFHAEFFLKPDGTFQAIEINLRPPGGFTVDLMNDGSDVDLYDWWARVILGLDVPAHPSRLYFSAHVARRDGLQYANAPSTVKAWLGPALRRHQRVPTVFAQAMGDEVYLIRERNLQSLKGDIAFIQQLT